MKKFDSVQNSPGTKGYVSLTQLLYKIFPKYMLFNLSVKQKIITEKNVVKNTFKTTYFFVPLIMRWSRLAFIN